MFAKNAKDGPLKVAVLVDLAWTARAGGHVKCWENLARAAARRTTNLDLTIFFQGDQTQCIEWSDRVRFVLNRPVLSTQRFRFLDAVADHTDIAPVHPRLFTQLWQYDVIHTTDAYFAYTRTAECLAKFRRFALITSVHTDTPSYTRLYAEKALHRICGSRKKLAKRLVDNWRLPEYQAGIMNQRLAQHAARCHRVLVSERTDLQWLRELVGPRHTGILRRGVDKDLFHPRQRDRQRLRQQYGVPDDHFLLMFAGRVDSGKRVMILAKAAQILLARGLQIHVLIAGEGDQTSDIKQMLGPAVTLSSVVDAKTLAWFYASSDLFIFPSCIEVAPNVVLEAKASGLPPLVTPQGGGIFVRASGVDGILVESSDPVTWAEGITAIYDHPQRRDALAQAARADVENQHPSWDEVLSQDLIPVWKAAAAEVHGLPHLHDVPSAYTAADTAS